MPIFYDYNRYDSGASVWSDIFLQLLPCLLWHRAIEPDKISSMSKKDLLEKYYYSIEILDAIWLKIICIRKSYVREMSCALVYTSL